MEESGIGVEVVIGGGGDAGAGVGAVIVVAIGGTATISNVVGTMLSLRLRPPLGHCQFPLTQVPQGAPASSFTPSPWGLSLQSFAICLPHTHVSPEG